MGCEIRNLLLISLLSHSSMVPEDSISNLKPCEHQQRYAQAQHAYPGSRVHIPQCDDQGNFMPLQCHGNTGFCWCVDQNGQEVPGTQTPPGSTPPHCGPPSGEFTCPKERLCASWGLESKNKMALAVGWFITELRRRCYWLLCFHSFLFPPTNTWKI